MDTVTEQAWRIGTCIQKIRSEETDETRAQRLICLRFSHTTYTLSLVELENLLEMAHSSNLIIGSTFNSAQGDFHIHNTKDSDSGMHNFRSVQNLKSLLINDQV